MIEVDDRINLAYDFFYNKNTTKTYKVSEYVDVAADPANYKADLTKAGADAFVNSLFNAQCRLLGKHHDGVVFELYGVHNVDVLIRPYSNPEDKDDPTSLINHGLIVHTMLTNVLAARKTKGVVIPIANADILKGALDMFLSKLPAKDKREISDFMALPASTVLNVAVKERFFKKRSLAQALKDVGADAKADVLKQAKDTLDAIRSHKGLENFAHNKMTADNIDVYYLTEAAPTFKLKLDHFEFATLKSGKSTDLADLERSIDEALGGGVASHKRPDSQNILPSTSIATAMTRKANNDDSDRAEKKAATKVVNGRRELMQDYDFVISRRTLMRGGGSNSSSDSSDSSSDESEPAVFRKASRRDDSSSSEPDKKSRKSKKSHKKHSKKHANKHSKKSSRKHSNGRNDDDLFISQQQPQPYGVPPQPVNKFANMFGIDAGNLNGLVAPNMQQFPAGFGAPMMQQPMMNPMMGAQPMMNPMAMTAPQMMNPMMMPSQQMPDFGAIAAGMGHHAALSSGEPQGLAGLNASPLSSLMQMTGSASASQLGAPSLAAPGMDSGARLSQMGGGLDARAFALPTISSLMGAGNKNINSSTFALPTISSLQNGGFFF